MILDLSIDLFDLALDPKSHARTIRLFYFAILLYGQALPCNIRLQ